MLESISFGTERLLGVVLYCTMLLLFVALVNVSNNKKKAYLLMDIYAVVLTIMAFLYVPSFSSDLTRIRALASTYWMGNGIHYFFTNVFMKSPTPVAYLIVYLCESTSVEGLLPALCAFIFYRCIFSIIKDSSDCYDANTKQISLVLMFVMSTTFFIDAIGGIRTALSFIIVARLFCNEVFNQKSFVKHIPLYLVACLIHNVAIPIVFIILITYLLSAENKTQNRKYVIAFVLLLFAAIAIVGVSFISVAFNKLVGYLTNSPYYDVKRYGAAIVLFLIFATCYYEKNKSDDSVVSERFLKTLTLLFVFDFLFIINFVIFARYMMILEILFIPVIFSLLKSNSEQSERNVLIINCICLFISYAMGDLSAYKFFEI